MEKPVDIVYLDFCKAFDSVPHLRLLNKLSASGIGGKLHAWISAYLTGRKQRVTVNGAHSGWSQVKSGIPQGSVLGPTLFTIFINDLPNVIKNSVYIFADDTKIFADVSKNCWPGVAPIRSA